MSKSKQNPRVRVVAVIAAAIVVAAGIVILSADARRAINDLGVASSDSSLWSLSQTEVELGRFETALVRAANSDEPDLATVRRQFDILYSRFQIVLRGSSLRILRSEEDLRPNIDAIDSFAKRTVLLIDGPDADLVANLPVLKADTHALRDNVRALSLRGVQVFSTRSKARREDVGSALSRLAILTVLLVVALAGGLYALNYLFRISRTEVQRSTEARRQLQSVVSASLDPIIATDRDGKIVEFNNAAETVFGHNRSDVIGRSMAPLIFPPHLRATMEDTLAQHNLDDAASHSKGRRLKFDVMRVSGEIFPAEVSVSSSQDGNGEILVIYLRDISDQIRAERELVQARDHAVAGERAKADLLAVMSHEMRTPLNGLLGTLELLRGTLLSEKQKDYAQIMQRSGDILLHNVNDVLEISRIDSGRFEISRAPFDPEKLLRDIVEEQHGPARAKGNEIIVETEAETPPVILGDEVRMRQILLNLIGNAIKFTRNGTITASLDFDTAREELTVSVTDSGIGIGPEDIDRVFDDFVTLDPSYNRSAEGSGLGLGICRRLTEAMGGEIGVESEPGEGSAFWFRIPAEPTNAAVQTTLPGTIADDTTPSSGAEASVARDILVVEDNQINRRVVHEMLKNLGCEVVEAHDGLEGVNAAKLRRYDLILMDISMPGLDGLEATKKIRSGGGPNAKTPIIALTAHALPSDHERFRSVGMRDAITKPISQARLATAIGIPLAYQGATKPDGLDEPELSIDLEVLDDLKSAMAPDLFQRMMAQFLQETTEALASLSEDCANDVDPLTLAEDIHKLAGSAAVFGATRFRSLLAEQEKAARDGRSRDLQEALSDLDYAWEETKSDLTKIAGEAA